MQPAADSALIGWLRLLGWAVETGRDGDDYVAVARREGDGDRELVAVATTKSASSLSRAIFSAAFDRLEASRAETPGYAQAA